MDQVQVATLQREKEIAQGMVKILAQRHHKDRLLLVKEALTLDAPSVEKEEPAAKKKMWGR